MCTSLKLFETTKIEKIPRSIFLFVLKVSLFDFTIYIVTFLIFVFVEVAQIEDWIGEEKFILPKDFKKIVFIVYCYIAMQCLLHMTKALVLPFFYSKIDL